MPIAPDPSPAVGGASGRLRPQPWSRLRAALLLWLLALALALAACDESAATASASATRTPNAPATRAAAATATRAAEPVWVDVAATMEGSVAQHNALMHITVTVTNRTDAPIYLTRSCEHPDIFLAIQYAPTEYLWVNSAPLGCPTDEAFDVQPPIAAANARTWSYQANLEAMPDAATTLRPGRYTVVAEIHLWHQRPLDQLNPDSVVPHGKASGETTALVT